MPTETRMQKIEEQAKNQGENIAALQEQLRKLETNQSMLAEISMRLEENTKL